MEYGIALFPSQEVQDKVDEYRKRYDTHYALIRPHVTIKDSFQADASEEAEIINYIKKVASQHEPVEISIKKVSSFEPTSMVIYFKVERTEELEALNKDFTKGDFYGENEHPFVPHITIAQELSSQSHDDVYDTLKMIGFNHSEIVDTLTLCKRSETGEWEVVEHFKLGRE